MTTISQAGVIPWRGDPSNPEILLITSRRAGRWIIPKGMIDNGMKKREAACQEAWEEAGLRGEILGKRLGAYTYRKNGSLFRVSVFPMVVYNMLDDYPEAGQRKREWLSVHDAVRRIENMELAKLVATLPCTLSAPSPLGCELAS